MTASDEAPASGLPRPARKRRPASLARAVTAELVDRVVHGTYPPGTPLPPEPVLGQVFGVSRTVVREAVKVLQEKGLVQVRQGAGTIVSAPVRWDMLDELVLRASIETEEGMTILDDLVVTRRVLESDMANVAARAAGHETVERLRVLVEEMDELVDDHLAYARHDRAFHDTVMQASGNRLARGVVRALESQVVSTARYMGRPERALCVASNRGHRRVYECIAARDAEGAAEAMFTHITEAWLVRRGGPDNPLRLRR
ncbi:MAG: FCD domain-containing protein [Actinomycetota bacterium]|nr:FCD domain-containing protein [Actinomycetota bacterium]